MSICCCCTAVLTLTRMRWHSSLQYQSPAVQVPGRAAWCPTQHGKPLGNTAGWQAANKKRDPPSQRQAANTSPPPPPVATTLALTLGHRVQVCHAAFLEAAHVELALALVAQHDGAGAKAAALEVHLVAQHAPARQRVQLGDDLAGAAGVGGWGWGRGECGVPWGGAPVKE